MDLDGSSATAAYQADNVTEELISKFDQAWGEGTTDDWTDKQISQFKEAFLLINKDGIVTTKQLENVMKSIINIGGLLDVIIENMIKESDLTGDGFINFSEFLTMIKCLMKDTKDKESFHRAIFRLYDKNSDGFIMAQELRHVLTVLHEKKFTKNEIKERMKSVDSIIDGDKKQVNYEEYFQARRKF